MFQRVGTIYWPVSGSRNNVSRCHAASRGSSPSPSPPPPPCRARCGFLSGQRETNAWFGLAAWCRACRLVRPTKTNILECTHRGSVARIGHLKRGQIGCLANTLNTTCMLHPYILYLPHMHRCAMYDDTGNPRCGSQPCRHNRGAQGRAQVHCCHYTGIMRTMEGCRHF